MSLERPANNNQLHEEEPRPGTSRRCPFQHRSYIELRPMQLPSAREPLSIVLDGPTRRPGLVRSSAIDLNPMQVIPARETFSIFLNGTREGPVRVRSCPVNASSIELHQMQHLPAMASFAQPRQDKNKNRCSQQNTNSGEALCIPIALEDLPRPADLDAVEVQDNFNQNNGVENEHPRNKHMTFLLASVSIILIAFIGFFILSFRDTLKKSG